MPNEKALNYMKKKFCKSWGSYNNNDNNNNSNKKKKKKEKKEKKKEKKKKNYIVYSITVGSQTACISYTNNATHSKQSLGIEIY